MVVIVEYIWLGAKNEFRGKTMVLQVDKITSVEQLPDWNYDGSSTGQSVGKNSEILLKPRAIFPCPFRMDNNLIALCDTWFPGSLEPLPNSFRSWAKEIFDLNLSEEPWFGIEQEYFLVSPETRKPLGFTLNTSPPPQGQYYCGVGPLNVFSREVVEAHLLACLHANIKMSGINAEVAPGQWEYQVGPCLGIEAGDQLWVSRYILLRVAEKFNLMVDFEPKPLKGMWNGSGCHTNFSTKNMREGTTTESGLEHIMKAIKRLSNKHVEHMQHYGENNEQRMTGAHETSSFNEFSYGVGERGCSVRIGTETKNNQKGYFEDRRPASNMDPYLVTANLFKTCCLED